MYKCKECDFVSMNEKSFMAHMEKAHQVKQPKQIIKSAHEPNFLHNMLDKKVEIETLGGKTLTGILIEYNKYEVQLKLSDDKVVLLWKHGLLSICEVR